MPKALDEQIGGDQYKKGIQPFQISLANDHTQRAEAIRACIRDMAEATFPDYYVRKDFI